jgi:hypothetical protein
MMLRGSNAMSSSHNPNAMGASHDTAVSAGAYTRSLQSSIELLRDTSLTLELNLSIFGTHPRVNSGDLGDKVSSS